MYLIDSHCHLDFTEFDADREQVLQKCWQQGVRSIVIPATRAACWDRTISVAGQYKGLFFALGLHPFFLQEENASDVEKLEGYCKQYSPLAVGEIGLDYYQPEQQNSRKQQKAVFIAQLKIAARLDLPVIIHCRKAHDEVLWCLRRYPVKGGVIHAFNGSEQQARQYQDLSFKLGFGGAMTWNRAKHLRYLACHLPLSSLLLETDAPDMLPAFATHQRNTPENLPGIGQCLVGLRQENSDEISQQLLHNAKQVLNLPLGNRRKSNDQFTQDRTLYSRREKGE